MPKFGPQFLPNPKHWENSINTMQESLVLVEENRKCETKFRKTCHSLIQKAFFEYMYKVWISTIVRNHGLFY
jgi:hypothetical protein